MKKKLLIISIILLMLPVLVFVSAGCSGGDDRGVSFSVVQQAFEYAGFEVEATATMLSATHESGDMFMLVVMSSRQGAQQQYKFFNEHMVVEHVITAHYQGVMVWIGTHAALAIFSNIIGL